MNYDLTCEMIEWEWEEGELAFDLFLTNCFQLANAGVEEYEVCSALRDGTIKKPLIAWCIGTCATMFNSEVQFGHAGSCANADRETAVSKNKALADAGAKVPQSFDDLGDVIHKVN